MSLTKWHWNFLRIPADAFLGTVFFWSRAVSRAVADWYDGAWNGAWRGTAHGRFCELGIFRVVLQIWISANANLWLWMFENDFEILMRMKNVFVINESSVLTRRKWKSHGREWKCSKRFSIIPKIHFKQKRKSWLKNCLINLPILAKLHRNLQKS